MGDNEGRETNFVKFQPATGEGERSSFGNFSWVETVSTSENHFDIPDTQTSSPFRVSVRNRSDQLTIMPINAIVSYALNDVIYSGPLVDTTKKDIVSQFVSNVTLLKPDGTILQPNVDDIPYYEKEAAVERISATMEFVSPHALAAGLLPECYVATIPTNDSMGTFTTATKEKPLEKKHIQVQKVGERKTIYLPETREAMLNRIRESSGLKKNIGSIVQSLHAKVAGESNDEIVRSFEASMFAELPFDMLAKKYEDVLGSEADEDIRRGQVNKLTKIRSAINKYLEFYDRGLADKARGLKTVSEVLAIIPEDIKEKMIHTQKQARAIFMLNEAQTQILETAFLSPDVVLSRDAKFVAQALDALYRDSADFPNFQDYSQCLLAFKVATKSLGRQFIDETEGKNEWVTFGKEITRTALTLLEDL